MPRNLPEDDDWIRARQQEIGVRLRAQRERLALTQEDVFLAAGLDRRTLQAVEAGQANPTLITLLRIAYVLDTSIGELLR